MVKMEFSAGVGLGEGSRHVINNRERLYILDAIKIATQPVIDRALRPTKGIVLEVGCGDGFVYRSLAPDWLKRRMVSSDIDMLALDRFMQRAPHARVIAADMRRLPVPDGSVGAIVGMSVYHMIHNKNDVIPGFLRALQPGGKVLLLQDNGVLLGRRQERLNEHVKGMGKEGMEKAHADVLEKFQAGGFRVVEGKNPIQAVVVKDVDVLKARGLYDETMQKALPGNVFLGVAYDRGEGEWLYAPKNQVYECMYEMQSILGVKGDLLAKQKFTPGKQFIEYERLRYLVAEKPRSSR